jgi:hypothetical protein
MKKLHKPTEELPDVVREPMVSYGVVEEEKTYTIPDDVMLQAWKAAIRDVDEGRAHSTREAMDIVDKRLGWK